MTNECATATGTGTILIEALFDNQWFECEIQNVLYMQNGYNLFSKVVITDGGFKIIGDDLTTEFYKLDHQGKRNT